MFKILVYLCSVNKHEGVSSVSFFSHHTLAHWFVIIIDDINRSIVITEATKRLLTIQQKVITVSSYSKNCINLFN